MTTTYAHGTQATEAIASIIPLLGRWAGDNTAADDGPVPRMVSDNEGDIAAGLEENATERQRRWFQC